MTTAATPYELNFEQRPDYLFAKVTADTITTETAIAYIQEIGAKCAELKFSRVMIYRDIPAVISTGSIYFLVHDLASILRGVKVAFVNPHPENQKGLDFATLFGSNRGGKFSLHSDIASAEEWLLK